MAQCTPMIFRPRAPSGIPGLPELGIVQVMFLTWQSLLGSHKIIYLLVYATNITTNIYWVLTLCQVVSILSIQVWMLHLILQPSYDESTTLTQFYKWGNLGRKDSWNGHAHPPSSWQQNCKCRESGSRACILHSALLCSLDQMLPLLG